MAVSESSTDSGCVRLRPFELFERTSNFLSRLHRVLWTRGVGSAVRRRIYEQRRSRTLIRFTAGDTLQDLAVARLRREGVQLVSAEQALALFGPEHSQVLSALRASIADGSTRLASGALQSEAIFRTRPELYKVGLAAPVLTLAKRYLGLDCYYLGASFKREAADGRACGTRQWHMDMEDEKLFRVIVYLAPVREDGGPFEYIAKPSSQEAKVYFRYRLGFLSDDCMRKLASEDQWRPVYGGAGDAVLFDGAAVFHRTQPPTRADRYSITLTYASRHPLELQFSSRLSRRSRRRLLGQLTPEQQACVPPPVLLW